MVNFIMTDFELFLRTEKDHCTNTVWSYMMPLRRIIYIAINNGWLQCDPFYGYSITKEETKRGFLTKDDKLLPVPCYPNCKNGINRPSKSGNFGKTWLYNHILAPVLGLFQIETIYLYQVLDKN